MNKLYVVEMLPRQRQDMTRRARRILDQVTTIVVLPKDMHKAHSLLVGCGIQLKSIKPCDQETILACLKTGDVALLAHTASKIDTLIRSLVKRAVPIIPIPGPVDQITALVVSGFPAERFVFLGSLPASRSELLAVWQNVANDSHTIICDIWAQNQCVVFDTLETVLGERRVVLYQAGHIWRGNTSQSPTEWQETGFSITLVIDGETKPIQVWSEEMMRAEIEANLKSGVSPRDIARDIAPRTGWKKRQIYALTTLIKAERDPDHTEQ